MLIYLLTLAAPVTIWALCKARWDYRRHGRVTPFGLISICVMLFVPTLMLGYATTYQMPTTVLDVIGVFVAVLGLAVCCVSIFAFRSLPKVLCLDAGRLTASGLYRWNRNPQYVGWFLFQLGFALSDWSLWCLAALLLCAIIPHLLVLVEEEHLRRVFGAEYRAFCQKTPRYLGWRFVRL